MINRETIEHLYNNLMKDFDDRIADQKRKPIDHSDPDAGLKLSYRVVWLEAQKEGVKNFYELIASNIK